MYVEKIRRKGLMIFGRAWLGESNPQVPKHTENNLTQYNTCKLSEMRAGYIALYIIIIIIIIISRSLNKFIALNL